MGAKVKFRRRNELAAAALLLGLLIDAAAASGSDRYRAMIPADLSGRSYTHYVRPDGGPPSVCNGRYDAPARVDSKNCAWSSPLHAWNPMRLNSGDALFIAAGEYDIGYGVSELELCPTPGRWRCAPQELPDSIVVSGDCSNPPKLIAVERVGKVLNLGGTSDALIRCLEITDGEACAEHHLGGNPSPHKCRRDKAPYGRWGPNALFAFDSARVTLDRINIHGMANRCARIGKLTDWQILESRFSGCGKAGVDMDIVRTDDDSNSGYIRFVDTEISWNGCIEPLEPGRRPFGCFAQNQGGYGDGLGTQKSGGDWLFERVRVEHNTSDGIDLLYLNRGENLGAKITVRDSWLAHNAGSQLKVHAGGVIENNVILGDCAAHSDATMLDGDRCRANGNALSISGLHLSPVQTALVRGNTLRGHGDCLAVTPSRGGKVIFQNNVFVGDLDWRANRKRRTGERTCGFYCDKSRKCPDLEVVFEKNLFWRVKHNQCLGSGAICREPPAFVNEDYATFDPRMSGRAGEFGVGVNVERLPTRKWRD